MARYRAEGETAFEPRSNAALLAVFVVVEGRVGRRAAIACREVGGLAEFVRRHIGQNWLTRRWACSTGSALATVGVHALRARPAAAYTRSWRSAPEPVR
jgi:hypothetical protein